mmetsp:Transcript_131786/g.328649  ORF Transcript_131786/g.328649 Transcript_131786/m.328649 type:complete len:393 (+) Transcript_131786:228-1406(+)
MFEDWSPSGPARRGRCSVDEEFGLKTQRVQASMGLTRAQMRHARHTVTVLGLVVITVALVLWRELASGLDEIQADRLLHGSPAAPLATQSFSAGGSNNRPVRWPDSSDEPAVPLEDRTFNATRLQALDHLILVAGHAVVLAEALDGVDTHDTLWYLEHYQRDQDLPGALVGHIRRGVEAASADPRALLVFSGGQTRPAAGPRDEGSSYYRVAEHYGWWGHTTPTTSRLAQRSLRAVGKDVPLPVPQRTVTEDFASDSFQNLLFSLCRFKEVVGHYPARVTVVSFTFKRRRFEDLHRAALRFPHGRFTFLGLQPPSWSRFDLVEAERGEVENAARSYENDPYGCHTPALAAKREARNPFRRTTPYALSCPDMRTLLAWCGPGLFPHALPWSSA